MAYDDEETVRNAGLSAYDRMMGNSADPASAAGSTSSTGDTGTSSTSSESDTSGQEQAEATTTTTQTSNAAAKTDLPSPGIVSPQVTSRAEQVSNTAAKTSLPAGGATYQPTGTGTAAVAASTTPAPTSNAAAKTSLPRQATSPNTPVTPSYDPISTFMDLMSLFGGMPQQQQAYDPLSSASVPTSAYEDMGMVWNKPFSQAIGGIVAGVPQSIYGPQPGATMPGQSFGGIDDMMADAPFPAYANAVKASVLDGTMAGGIATPKIADRVPMEPSQIAGMMADALRGLPNEAQPTSMAATAAPSQITDAELGRQIADALARMSAPPTGQLAVGNPLPGVDAYNRPVAGIIAGANMDPAMARAGFPTLAQPNGLAQSDVSPAMARGEFAAPYSPSALSQSPMDTPLARGTFPTPQQPTAMAQADMQPPMVRGGFPADPGNGLAQADATPPLSRMAPEPQPAASSPEQQSTIASIINGLLNAFAGTPSMANATPITTGETYTVEPMPQDPLDIASATPNQTVYKSPVDDFAMSGPDAGLSSGLPQTGGAIDLTQEAYNQSLAGPEGEPISGPETQPDPGSDAIDIPDAPSTDGYPPAGQPESPPSIQEEIANVIAEAPPEFVGVIQSLIGKLLNVPGNIVDGVTGMPGQIASYFPPNAMNPAQQGGNFGNMMRQAEHAGHGGPNTLFDLMMQQKLAEIQRERRNERNNQQLQLILSTFT